MSNEAHIQQLDAIAQQIIELAEGQIIAQHHFLSAAIGQLSLCAYELSQAFSTNGSALLYNPKVLANSFLESSDNNAHNLFHCVAHCLFLHPFASVENFANSNYWNLACDISAECAVLQVCGQRPGDYGAQIADALEVAGTKLGDDVTAERIYAAMLVGEFDEYLPTWNELFVIDSHEFWGVNLNEPSNDSQNASIGAHHGTGAIGQDTGIDSLLISSLNTTAIKLTQTQQARAKEEWQHTAARMNVELQTLSSAKAGNLRSLVQGISTANKSCVDYRRFLQQFAVPKQILRCSDSEFDNVFYTYGLSLYGNLPLIEPLEFRDSKLIREFVVAIDTSGSVYDEQVRKFVSLTYEILQTSQTFDTQVHVTVIQCDSAVQQVDTLNSADELRKWCGKMHVYGGGGTDFRPVFRYIDTEVKQCQMSQPEGLIYFTDGDGIYPNWTPSYKTACVFCDQLPNQSIPPWAICAVIDSKQVDDAKWK